METYAVVNIVKPFGKVAAVADVAGTRRKIRELLTVGNLASNDKRLYTNRLNEAGNNGQLLFYVAQGVMYTLKVKAMLGDAASADLARKVFPNGFVGFTAKDWEPLPQVAAAPTGKPFDEVEAAADVAGTYKKICKVLYSFADSTRAIFIEELCKAGTDGDALFEIVSTIRNSISSNEGHVYYEDWKSPCGKMFQRLFPNDIVEFTAKQIKDMRKHKIEYIRSYIPTYTERALWKIYGNGGYVGR